ncbi:MAG: hypothetical protein AB1450_05020 [Pseudomonadota bacterium]
MPHLFPVAVMLSDFQTLTDSLVRDEEGKISTPQRDQAIALAVVRYGKDRPRELVEDATGDGTQYLALPAQWEAGISGLRAIEYPIGAIPPTYIQPGCWGIYNLPGGVQKIAMQQGIAFGADARLTYTVSHTVTDVVDTVPVTNREAVACWAAALLCDQLAALYSGTSDPTIQADSVQHQSKAAEFAKRGNSLRTRYYNELGIDPKRNAAAGAVVNLDLPNSLGQDRLTHPARLR